jgi:glycerol-3-phosphate acyltransferase PlsY
MSEPLGGLIVLILIVVAFLVGSIPFGVVVGRGLFHTDIRNSGSGNIGAANALRTFGVPGAIAVLLLDSLKGFAPTWAVVWLAVPLTGAAEVAGFAALLGHCYSPWLGWRGGKGVATHLGVVFALSWESGLAFMAAFIIAMVPTGYSSVGSLTATVVAALSLWYFAGPAALCYGVAAGALIFWRHRENIARLRAGTELPTTLLRRTRVP